MGVISLRGMTWDHPRGFDPLAGGVSIYQRNHPDVDIVWEKRSLREFGEAPIESYASRYDLLIIDHPFVGDAAQTPCLIDWSAHLSADDRRAFSEDSVGNSWSSYHYHDRIWALPIDAATQVASYRPDLLANLGSGPPITFEDLLALATRARKRGMFVCTTAFPTDAISTVISIAGNLGHLIVDQTPIFLPETIGREVMSRFRAIVDVGHPNSIRWNPISAYDYMSAHDDVVYCAYGYGYTNYSRRENRNKLRFGDVVAHSTNGPAGTQLGGTGIAVSSQCAHPDAALEYARWLCTVAHQTGDYYRLGGQPASLAAWSSPDLNADCDSFFFNTLATLQGAHVRPRFNGWIPFFEAAGERVAACLRRELSEAALLSWLNQGFARAQDAAKIARA